MRCGILTGTGRAFSAGADLKEMNQRNVDRGERGAPTRTFDPATSLPFSRSPKPFVAAINGLCIAGGLERALDCDIRICSTDAWFGLFEVKRGILAGYAIHHLARLVPFSDAMYILLTGDRVEPPDALRMGLVREVLDPDELMPRAEADRGHDRRKRPPLRGGQQVHGAAVAAAHDRRVVPHRRVGQPRRPQLRGRKGRPARLLREAPGPLAGPLGSGCGKLFALGEIK